MISEFGILPTQPRPALEFYADSLHDQALRRSSAPSCVNIEHALSKCNKDPVLSDYFSRLLPPHAKKGQTVLGICSNFIRLQEGFPAIGSLAQHEWKFSALIIGFGLLTRQVGDRNIIRSRTFASASNYLMIVLGLGIRFRSRPWWRTIVKNEQDILIRYRDEYKFESLLDRMILRILGNREASYGYTIMSGKAKMRKSRAMIKSGSVFWEAVGSLALRMPEVDDIVTQVGLMCTVLVDARILCSHSMSDPDFHHWSQDINLRSLVLMAYTGGADWKPHFAHDYVAKTSNE